MGRREKVEVNDMSRKVVWDWGEKLSHEQIKAVENLWNIKFPKEYVEIIKEYDGATAKLEIDGVKYKYCGIDIPKWHGGRSGLYLLEYNGYGDVNTWSIVRTYEAFKECLPNLKKYFRLLEMLGGDIFFFDYRHSDTEPSIIFLPHNESVTEDEIDEDDLEERTLAEWQDLTLYKVADSFSEFLDKITPDED